MEPCCGMARTAGRRAARRAIFRTAIAIDVQSARAYDSIGNQVERVGIEIWDCYWYLCWLSICVVDSEECQRADQGCKESVKVNDGPNECNERMLLNERLCDKCQAQRQRGEVKKKKREKKEQKKKENEIEF